MALQSPLLALHEAAGATMGEYFGMRLPKTFHDLNVEYRAARETVALVDANYRTLFSLNGSDSRRYANAVLTSNVRDLKPAHGTVGLLLNPQGHILAEIETFAISDGLLASTHAIARERTLSTLEKFIIMDDATVEDFSSTLGMLDVVGPRSAELISQFTQVDIQELPALGHVEAKLAGIPCRVIRREGPGGSGTGIAASIIYPVEHLAACWTSLAAGAKVLHGMAVGMEAINSIRLEYGVPWFSHDYDDKNIPHEAGLENSHISYEKGCYTGQEIVERVRSRGHVNRRLTRLQFAGDHAPSPGTKVFASASGTSIEAGHITSTAFSPSAAKFIGLALLRKEHSAPGTRLDASGIEAQVTESPASHQAGS